MCRTPLNVRLKSPNDLHAKGPELAAIDVKNLPPAGSKFLTSSATYLRKFLTSSAGSCRYVARDLLQLHSQAQSSPYRMWWRNVPDIDSVLYMTGILCPKRYCTDGMKHLRLSVLIHWVSLSYPYSNTDWILPDYHLWYTKKKMQERFRLIPACVNGTQWRNIRWKQKSQKLLASRAFPWSSQVVHC